MVDFSLARPVYGRRGTSPAATALRQNVLAAGLQTARKADNAMQGSVPPPDEAAHLDSVLIARIAEVNTMLGRYVLRFLDADAGRAESVSAEDERALAEQVARVADGLRARARRRELGIAERPLNGCSE